jgi:hypothetical protein
MLTFNKFLAEATADETLDVDATHVNGNFDAINADLDVLTEKSYQNAPIFLNQLRGTLERYGILLPQSATEQFLDLGAEIAYLLGNSNVHLYIVYDTNDDGYVDGYAQLVLPEELRSLMSMDSEDLLDKDDDKIEMRPSTWYAKRDDDSGNDDEYT